MPVPTPFPALAAGAVVLGVLGAAALAPAAPPPRATAPVDLPVELPADATPRARPEGRPGSVVLPLSRTTLLRGFEEPTARWGPGHRGVDLAAPVGTAVLSPADGVVVVATRVVDRDVVTVRHDDGLRSSLEPVLPDLAVGTVVAAGAVVGHVSTGGHCVGCLHWGVREGDVYVDPLALLDVEREVRLLPVGDR